MVKACLTCINDTEDETDFTVPKWSQKMGNYSALPPMLNCDSKYNANKNTLVEEKPKGKDLVTISLKTKPNTWVFYWASEGRKKQDTILPAEKAYGNFTNRGLLQTNAEGNVKLECLCPQIYEADGEVYPRHIHYVLLNEDKTWDFENVKTRTITCQLSTKEFKQLVDKSNHLIIQGINDSYPESTDVKGVVYIDMDTNKTKEIKSILEEEIENNKHLHSLKKDRLPIIVYCPHKDNLLSLKLQEKLINLGFMNILMYVKEGKETKVQEDPLSYEEETLVFEGVPYIHDLVSDEVTYEGFYVGLWDGKQIRWKHKGDEKHKELVGYFTDETDIEVNKPVVKEEKKEENKEEKKEEQRKSIQKDSLTALNETLSKINLQQKGGAPPPRPLDSIYVSHKIGGYLQIGKFRGWGYTLF
jgi:hypothetical protein